MGIPAGPGWNGAAGDYIGVASVDEAAYAIWTDTRSGTNDLHGNAYYFLRNQALNANEGEKLHVEITIADNGVGMSLEEVFLQLTTSEEPVTA